MDDSDTVLVEALHTMRRGAKMMYSRLVELGRIEGLEDGHPEAVAGVEMGFETVMKELKTGRLPGDQIN
jgi:hypothetical protein